MKIDGSCHCGAIRYEAEIDPGGVSICHCVDCQKLTGSAFRLTVAAKEENFRLTAGTPKVYVKTAASGAKRAQGFCAECGSPIYATSVGDGRKIYGLRWGPFASVTSSGHRCRSGGLGVALGARLWGLETRDGET